MPIQLEINQQPVNALTTLSFSGGERHVQLMSLPETLQQITLRAYIRNSDDLLDLFLVHNALSNRYPQGLTINIEIPYLPYARQDRVCASGQAFSLEVFATWLQALNLSTLVTWDCHSDVGLTLTGAHNVTATEIIKSNQRLYDLLREDNSVLICPDKGAVKRCTALKNDLDIKHMVRCEKKRDPATGKIFKTEVLSDDLSGKTAIISDDICDGGYTFIKIAEQLKEKNAQRIILFVTHGIFSKGLEVFDGLIDHIFTTPSFPQQDNEKLTTINFNYNFGE